MKPLIIGAVILVVACAAVVIPIRLLVYALNTPQRDAQEHAKAAVRKNFRIIRESIDAAMERGDGQRAAGAAHTAATSAPVERLRLELSSTDITMEMAIFGDADEGAGFNAASAGAVACVRVSGRFVEKPKWKSISCPPSLDLTAPRNVSKPIREFTLDMSRV